MDQQEFIDLVERAAQARDEPPVPRQYIEEALRRIDAGQEEVTRYPMGAPSLKGVYDIAVTLASLTATENRTYLILSPLPTDDRLPI